MARTGTKVPPPPAPAIIRAVAVQRLAERIDHADERATALLGRYGIAPARLIDPYGVIPLERYVALMEEMAELTGMPHLGAEMAGNFRPADIGPVGLIFSLSGTLRSAFARMDRYLPAFQTSTSSGLVNAGEHVLWAYRINDQRIWPRRQDAEYAVMATCGLIRSCLTTPWWPIEVHFEHSAPANPAPLRRMFRAPVLFDQPANGLLLDPRDVDRINRREDRDLIQILERHVVELLKVEPADDSYAAQVGKLIGIYLGNRSITIDSMATALGLPPRSLQRRLADEGTSLRRLLREHRTQIAAARLRDRDSDMTVLANMLGYSDRSVVSRAYRRWTGHSPVRGRDLPRGDDANQGTD